MIDLFASRENRQVDRFCSRGPEEEAFQVDSLVMNWSRIDSYVFPPISLIHLVLDRVEKFQCVITLVAPYWQRRSWLPRLLDLMVDIPLQLPNRPDLLQQWQGTIWHQNLDKFNLIAWKVFLGKLSTQCNVHILGNGEALQIGVVNGVMIHAQLL
jgi:hypothetical protein